VVEHARSFVPDDPVVHTIRVVISPEQIASEEPVRAADALVVAKQLDTAIGAPPLSIPASRSSVLPRFQTSSNVEPPTMAGAQTAVERERRGPAAAPDPAFSSWATARARLAGLPAGR
jgi:hypothetical protein